MKKFYLTILGGLLFSLQLQAQCTELFFSEYIEGSGNNKALEIYNPTNKSVDLSNYKIYMINNGGSANDASFQMVGTLAAYGTFVIGNDAAAAGLKSRSDTLRPYNSVVHFNGNDGVVLLKGTDTIDAIGERWKNPGTRWTVGSGSTLDYTLVRKAGVKGGELDWSTASGQWDVYPKDTFMYLGSHTCDCYVPVIPEISFSGATASVGEGDGTGTLEISIVNAMSGTTSINIDVTGGTAVSGTDYVANVPSNISFTGPGGSTQKFNFTIKDNPSPNADKTIIFKISSATNSAKFGKDSMITVTIVDNDYKVSTIAGVRTADANLNITNKGEKVEVTGVVYGIDYDGNAGYSFTIIDATAGINIFNFQDVSGYVVDEGDEITVRGEIEFYNGLTEIVVDSIRWNSLGNALKAPMAVQKPTEATESQYIKISKIWIADTTTIWPSNGNVWVTNEMKDTFQVRIDKDAIDIVGTKVMYDTMNITGLGGQFDATEPYNSGYQIFPRTLSDIEKWEDKSSVRDLKIISSIFPNPTSGLVTVHTIQPVTALTITDLLGHVVYSQNNPAANKLTVDMSSFTKGVYFIHVSTNNITSVEKVILK